MANKFEENIKGKFFHLINDEGKINYQGCIEGETEAHYIVRFYDWAIGAENEETSLVRKGAVKLEYMYDSDCAMRAAYHAYSR